MVHGHSRPVESGSRKNGGDDVGILGGMPGDGGGSPDRMEVGMEVEDEEMICPVCSGSGESPWGPAGQGCCHECGGDGVLREDDEDYEDLVAMSEEWERRMR